MRGKEWSILKERSSNTEILLVFLRSPRLGQVKTRLAADLGQKKALVYYQRFVAITLGAAAVWKKAATDGQIRKIRLCYTPEQDIDLMQNWLGREYTFLAQSGSGLGERMAGAMEASFDAGADRVLLAGTDIPDLEASHLMDASAALRSHDLVFGPSRDGGYWLVGAASQGYSREIFSRMPWGTNQVLEQTLAQCRSLGRSWALLPWLQDVDTAGDLRRTGFYRRGRSEAEG